MTKHDFCPLVGERTIQTVTLVSTWCLQGVLGALRGGHLTQPGRAGQGFPEKEVDLKRQA